MGIAALNYDNISKIAESFGDGIAYNEKISEYTSFRIGGVCDVVVRPSSAQCIAELIAECRRSAIRYYIFGKCTNVLISDDGLRGVVILIDGSFSQVRREGENYLVCDAGASLSKVCQTARSEGLSGLEFAYGIPGTAGGALYMNAGAYGGEMKDVVKYCDYLDTDGTVKRMETADMQLSYRHSIFSGSEKVILSVCFGLDKGSEKEISAKMNETMQKRRDKQPLEFPSAGSTFKRPEGYFAAKLIEDSGLKGYTVGGAQVSEKHSGFVINKENATAADVRQLISDIRDKVYKDSGVMLECEMLFVE